MKKLITVCLVVLFAVNSYPVQASITGVALGTDTPPATLGPYTMTAFGPDSRPEYELVTSVSSPLGGTVDFSDEEMDHRIVGSSWESWGNGYTGGDVYWTGMNYTVVTLTMPSGTGAFYLYAEPNPQKIYKITAYTYAPYTEVSQMVDGNGGACGYGFWAGGTDQISTIEVDYFGDQEGGLGFAVGEFGIAAVPEPATIGLLSLGALGLIHRKK